MEYWCTTIVRAWFKLLAISQTHSQRKLYCAFVVLLVWLNHDLELALGQFAAECDMAEMRICTSNSKAHPQLGMTPSGGVQVSQGCGCCIDEERAECECKSAYLNSYPHLWSQALGGVMQLGLEVAEMSFFQRMAGLSFRRDSE